MSYMKEKCAVMLACMMIITLAGSTGYAQVRNVPADPETQYRNAIADAIYPGKSKIFRNLTAINKSNPRLVWKTIDGEDYLLVVSWQADTSYYHRNGFYNTGNYIIWVTAVPDLKEVCTRNGDGSDRLAQRFGLPPGAKKKFFVEFWVRPADLFRPCPDNEITDSACELCFPPGTDSSYISWFNMNRISSYYNCNLYSTYPWTQLGFTYDWNADNVTHVGLSEFIIGKNKNILIHSYISTENYCRKRK